MSPKQRVLIVDDEPRNQRIVVEILEDIVDFRLANNGEEALQIAEKFRPELVLLDIMMPGIDGYEVCRKIKENDDYKYSKVILVSGKAMIDERLKGYEVGADDYMTKPFAPEELLAKVKVFLRIARLEIELADMNRDLDEKVRQRTEALLNAEARLINTAKMSALGEMAAGIAHEINTPLAIISLTNEQISEVMADENPDKELLHKMTTTVAATVKRISGIINGLRFFSRDGQKDPLEMASLKDIVMSTLGLCNEKIKNHQIDVQLENLTDDFKIECRAVEISQVLLNLIGNACDATMVLDEKWIRISLLEEPDWITLTITDSGNGIPEAIRNRVFQPFFTTKDIGKGTGLGLSISKGIIESHKGEISIDTQSKHTKFVLRFPRTVSKTAVAA
jgi:C4-dicarboxylate-specific signal transduction histidine kinase